MGLLYGRDPENGDEDVTIHRMCLQGPDTLSIWFAPGRHIDVFRAKAEACLLYTSILIHNGHLSEAVHAGENGLCLEARPVTSFSFDESGALHAVFAPGDPLRLAADVIICASGLQADDTALSGVDVARTPRGGVAADPVTFRTSVPGLYAAGDIAIGPSLVARAIGQGRGAALAVHKALSGMDQMCIRDRDRGKERCTV